MIGIGLGILTALAFSSAPYRDLYLANYTVINSASVTEGFHEISLPNEKKNLSFDELTAAFREQLTVPISGNITNINLSYISTHERCFADTSIISETLREILKHISNKFFFISIGIVTIFYTITFILALHRQNPRIRALKQSLNVLNKFNAYPTNHHHHHQQEQRHDSIVSSYSPLYSKVKRKLSKIDSKRLSATDNQQYEMSSFISNDDTDEQNILNKPKTNSHINISDATSDDLHTSIERFPNAKQVSFQIDNSDDTSNHNDNQQISFLSNSFDNDSNPSNDTYYKFPCPCSTTRQLLIKFHFAQPTLDINQWLCFCCIKKPTSSSSPNRNSIEDERSNHHNSTPATNSEILRKQLHRHRIKQIRMASTFLLITVSFVLFYLPSILNAERIMKSPLMIYYLYLCTHALNPIIYCFMNMSLRAYVFSMLKCRTKQRRRSITTGGATTIMER